METEPAARPPEATLIQRARKAAGLTAEAAAAQVRQSGGKISATYWRDVERGYGGRRGQRVPARASDERLAQMARILGISPDRMETEGQRPDAAEVLREMLSDPAPGAEVIPLPVPADSLVQDLADARLAEIEEELGSPVDRDSKVERAIVAQHKTPRQIAFELREWRRMSVNPARGRGASGGR